MMKRIVIVILIVLAFSACLVSAEINKADENFVPDEIIIKLRDISSNNSSKVSRNENIDRDLKGSGEVAKLNSKYRAKEVQQLFRGFRSHQQKLEKLKTKPASQLSDKEKHILARSKRAPKGVKVPNLGGFYRIKFELNDGQTIQNVLKEYQACPEIETAELNYIVHILKEPNDPLYGLQWALRNIGQLYPASGRFVLPPGNQDSDIDADKAWDHVTGTANVVVAVIDTGVDYNHRDLYGNMWTNELELNGIAGVDDDDNGDIDDIYGLDFANNDSDPIDDNGHGTHCAGVISSRADNGFDTAGVSLNSKIMAVKFLGTNGSGSLGDAIESIYYAVNNGADVLSNSWGGVFPQSALENAVAYAYSQGVVFIASAGNISAAYPSFPAGYEHVIAVAATDSKDKKASFSNYGTQVDIAAPGVDILSLRAKGTALGIVYDEFTTILSGTSMACPQVAGACAVLLSVDPNASVTHIQDILMRSTDPINTSICQSGRLNVHKAVLMMFGSNGSIYLDSDAVSCDGEVKIGLYDADLEAAGIQLIEISGNGGDIETVTLSEDVSPDGLFLGSIVTSYDMVTLQDGVLQVADGEIITVAYYDLDNGSGQAEIKYDTMAVDCKKPIISEIEVVDKGPVPTVLFKTDNPAASRIFYRETMAGTNYIIAESLGFNFSHKITLPGVKPETGYSFAIEAADLAGNLILDDNMGNWYNFTTNGPGAILVPADYETIQEAIDRSWDAGEVIVSPGIYTGKGNRDIDFHKKAITVRSRDGAETCIIDCNGSNTEPHRAFYFHSGEDSNSVVSGFTIINGYAYGSTPKLQSGGAVFCDAGSPMITDCIMRENKGYWDGGAISNYNCSPIIKNCALINNQAIGNDGGAINNENCHTDIINCIITGNKAFDWGGAVRNIFASNVFIQNCLIAGNTTGGSGGAVFAWKECNIEIINSTLAENYALHGNALSTDSRDPNFINSVYMENCIVFNGGTEIVNKDGSEITIIYSDIKDGYEGIGNIDTDPCFVEAGFRDANNIWTGGDYHLRAKSGCINGGNPAYPFDANETDIDGQPRIVAGRIDIGADEFAGNNPPPVANAGPDQKLYAGLGGEVSVKLDGTGSYDPDGHTLSYLWKWIIGGEVFTAEGAIIDIELPVGEYQITLVVNDKIQDSEPDIVIVEVIKPVEAKLQVFPKAVNSNSNSNSNSKNTLTALISLPEMDHQDKVSDENIILYPGRIPAFQQNVIRLRGGKVMILAVFESRELPILFNGEKKLEIEIYGKFESGRYFRGSDTINLNQRK